MAQRLAQGTHNPWVLGSNPGGPTRFFNRSGNLSGLFLFHGNIFLQVACLPTSKRLGSRSWREVPGGDRAGAGKAGCGSTARLRARPAGMARHRGPSILCGSAPPRRDGESFSKIVLASPSEFPYSTSSHGGVAQLGERLTGSQEVRGSIPLVSTRALNEAPTQVGAFFHIGSQGQRQDHDPSDRKDRALNDHCAHGSISRRGATTR